jgi:hypothetical protein
LSGSARNHIVGHNRFRRCSAAPYLISYDLVAPGKEYPPLLDTLKRLGAVKVLYSEWLVYTMLSDGTVNNLLNGT